jgi:4-amino-4-deoxy-L-arabinose transferase-like glycosyltransferase
MDWRDEGLLAYGAVRVMEGQIPNRDFVSVQPPLSYYTSAAVFKLFGTSLLSLRVFGLSIFLLLPLLVYGVGRNFMGPVLCLAAAAPACVLGIPYMGFVPFAIWQGIAASFAAVLLFVPATLSKRQWLAVPAGSLTAISLFLRQDQAVYTAMAIVVLVIALGFARDECIPRKNLRAALLLWLAGAMMIVIPLMLIWWETGALPEMFRQLVVFPFATYRKTSSLPFPRLFVERSFLDTATALLFYIPLLVQAAALIYVAQAIVRRRFRFREAVLTFFAIWSALFYLQVSVRSDLTHLLVTLPPFFLLVAFGWSIVCISMVHHLRVRILTSAMLALVIASFLWVLRSVALPDMSGQTEELDLPRGGVRVARAAMIANFLRSVQAAVPPDRSILALPYQPMFYFLCERRNPTRWNYLWPGDQTAQDHQRLIEEAERDPPALVLLSQQPEVAVYAPAIVEFVQSHYIHTDDVGDIAIYVRPQTGLERW